MWEYREYAQWFRTIQNKLWYKIPLYMWSFGSFYDSILSQYIPETISRSFPKPWEVAVMTGGLLPYWGWLLILALILVVSSIEYAICKGRPTPTTGEVPKEMPSLKKLFDEDFANIMQQNANRKLGVKTGSVETFVLIPEKVYLDFAAKTKFVGYFISMSTPSPYDVCKFLSEMPKETIKDFDNIAEVQGGHTTEISMTSSKDLVFSGRVYIYHENNFSLQELASLEQLYKEKESSVLFRGISYLQMMSGQKVKK